ncbi:hypothetical protein GCM10010446_58760 [Streptomyces enissocaesilis]|uniref:Uncharacterized protein n=1 Tax=Streptomyces enissocaesilis TaxID=332589 RepID=A0ABN3XNT3_9ACTN
MGRPFPPTAAWPWEDDPRRSEETGAVRGQVFDRGPVVPGTDRGGMYERLTHCSPP